MYQNNKENYKSVYSLPGVPTILDLDRRGEYRVFLLQLENLALYNVMEFNILLMYRKQTQV